MNRELDPSFYAYDDWMSISEKLRIKIAELLNVSPDTITHSTSSSDVINIDRERIYFRKRGSE
jgi:hypothetical protein